MIGDFQYYSSSSEQSDSECGSDSDDSSDESLEKLMADKKTLEDKIQSYEDKLKYIQKTLKSLNEERKNLLMLKNKLIGAICDDNDNTMSKTLDNLDGTDNESTVNENLSNAPLDLNLNKLIKMENDEEFDSEEDEEL